MVKNYDVKQTTEPNVACIHAMAYVAIASFERATLELFQDGSRFRIFRQDVFLGIERCAAERRPLYLHASLRATCSAVIATLVEEAALGSQVVATACKCQRKGKVQTIIPREVKTRNF